MIDPEFEPPPSSQTPVVFETATPSVPSEPRPSQPRHARPSVLARLAPLAIVPALLSAIGLVSAIGPRACAPSSDARAQAIDIVRAQPSVHALVDFDRQTKPATNEPTLETLAPCPDGMSLVVRGDVRVCIDRWEASLVEIGKDGEEKLHSPYYTPMTWAGQRVKAVSRPGVVPQAYVSRWQASLACKAAQKRLCTGVEWQTACEGPSKSTYPYGEKRDVKACNVKGRNPMVSLVGGGKAYLWGTAMHHPLLNTYPKTLAKTGEWDRCTNDYGVYDMVGNLHEWTSDGAFRGGYYRDDVINGPGCRYQTTAHGPTYSDYSTGFRCCADPR